MALANDIGRFFVRKIERIRCDIDAVDFDHTARDALPDDVMLDNSIIGQYMLGLKVMFTHFVGKHAYQNLVQVPV